MLVRFTPWNEMSRLSQELERAFGFAPDAANTEAAASWPVPFDVTEDAGKLSLVADLPGVEQKDLDIQVEKNVLTVKGTRALPRVADSKDGELYRRYERPAGAFARSFRLAETVDAEKITASLRDGVLTLTIPKKPEAQPQKIKVAVH